MEERKNIAIEYNLKSWVTTIGQDQEIIQAALEILKHYILSLKARYETQNPSHQSE